MSLITNTEKNWARKVIAKCEEKYTWVAEKHANGIPYTTDKNGNYDDKNNDDNKQVAADGICWWTNGFWGGILWRIFANNGNKRMAEIACTSEKLLDRCFDEYYGLHHDVGFMWLPTSVVNYKLTNDAVARKRALHAANLLAGRFNPVGKYIRAWNDRVLGSADTSGWAIIDCMLNIPLLYWASEEIKDPRFKQIAMMHADTVMQTFIREDGSSHHIVEFDSEHGGVVKTYGGQGYENGSAWTRGQAWAVNGFVVSYKQTGKTEYLQTAKKIADYCISKMANSALIPVDFCQPPKPELEDSCAAAILAGGLLEIARCCEGVQADKYNKAALDILHTLDEKRANYNDDCDAILQNCTGSYHGKESHHITMVYADYFYISALHKIDPNKNENVFYW